MNQQQTMFHDFYMSLVKPDKRTEAEALLEAGFERQDAGTFDAAYLQRMKPAYFEFARPECLEQLKAAMAMFASKL